MDKRLEKNLVVKESILLALIKLMKKKPFDSITITELVSTAGVGRASFYRNYTSKEDVITKYLIWLFHNWKTEYDTKLSKLELTDTDKHTPEHNEGLIESYIGHICKNKQIYLLLHQAGLFHLVQKYFLQELGPKQEYTNRSAYNHAWFSYGLFGWIDEWIKRGMTESPKEMASLYPNMTIGTLLSH